jgi:hypothetical protein
LAAEKVHSEPLIDKQLSKGIDLCLSNR